MSLKSDKIPIESRIISIADIFEALIGQRPYRDPIEPVKAVRMMEDMHLDNNLLKILQDNLEEVIQLLSSFSNESY